MVTQLEILAATERYRIGARERGSALAEASIPRLLWEGVVGGQQFETEQQAAAWYSGLQPPQPLPTGPATVAGGLAGGLLAQAQLPQGFMKEAGEDIGQILGGLVGGYITKSPYGYVIGSGVGEWAGGLIGGGIEGTTPAGGQQMVTEGFIPGYQGSGIDPGEWMGYGQVLVPPARGKYFTNIPEQVVRQWRTPTTQFAIGSSGMWYSLTRYGWRRFRHRNPIVIGHTLELSNIRKFTRLAKSMRKIQRRLNAALPRREYKRHYRYHRRRR